MRAYLRIQFDRPITEEHIITPGGYEVVAGGRSYQFDFCSTNWGVDPKAPDTATFYLREEDTESFPEIQELKQHLSEIIRIEECYVHTGEAEDPGILPVKLLDFVIETASSGKLPVCKDTEEIHHERFSIRKGWIMQYRFTKKLLDQVNEQWKKEREENNGKIKHFSSTHQ